MPVALCACRAAARHAQRVEQTTRNPRRACRPRARRGRGQTLNKVRRRRCRAASPPPPRRFAVEDPPPTRSVPGGRSRQAASIRGGFRRALPSRAGTGRPHADRARRGRRSAPVRAGGARPVPVGVMRPEQRVAEAMAVGHRTGSAARAARPGRGAAAIADERGGRMSRCAPGPFSSPAPCPNRAGRRSTGGRLVEEPGARPGSPPASETAPPAIREHHQDEMFTTPPPRHVVPASIWPVIIVPGLVDDAEAAAMALMIQIMPTRVASRRGMSADGSCPGFWPRADAGSQAPCAARLPPGSGGPARGDAVHGVAEHHAGAGIA